MKFPMVLATAACATAVAVGLWGVRALADEPADNALAGAGLRMNLPQGWSGAVRRLPSYPDESIPGSAYLTAASLPLAQGDDDFGTRTMKRMQAEDVRIVLIEYDPPPDPQSAVEWKRGFRQLLEPLSIADDDFTSFEGIPPTHAFARRWFSIGGRYFDVWVDFATPAARARLLGRVNAGLATLEVGEDPGRSG